MVREKPELQNARLVRYATQVVAGTKYYLELETETIRYSVEIWEQKWLNSIKITDFKMTPKVAPTPTVPAPAASVPAAAANQQSYLLSYCSRQPGYTGATSCPPNILNSVRTLTPNVDMENVQNYNRLLLNIGTIHQLWLKINNQIQQILALESQAGAVSGLYTCPFA